MKSSDNPSFTIQSHTPPLSQSQTDKSSSFGSISTLPFYEEADTYSQSTQVSSNTLPGVLNVDDLVSTDTTITESTTICLNSISLKPTFDISPSCSTLKTDQSDFRESELVADDMEKINVSNQVLVSADTSLDKLSEAPAHQPQRTDKSLMAPCFENLPPPENEKVDAMPIQKDAHLFTAVADLTDAPSQIDLASNATCLAEPKDFLVTVEDEHSFSESDADPSDKPTFETVIPRSDSNLLPSTVIDVSGSQLMLNQQSDVNSTVAEESASKHVVLSDGQVKQNLITQDSVPPAEGTRAPYQNIQRLTSDERGGTQGLETSPVVINVKEDPASSLAHDLGSDFCALNVGAPHTTNVESKVFSARVKSGSTTELTHTAGIDRSMPGNLLNLSDNPKIQEEVTSEMCPVPRYSAEHQVTPEIGSDQPVKPNLSPLMSAPTDKHSVSTLDTKALNENLIQESGTVLSHLHPPSIHGTVPDDPPNVPSYGLKYSPEVTPDVFRNPGEEHNDSKYVLVGDIDSGGKEPISETPLHPRMTADLMQGTSVSGPGPTMAGAMLRAGKQENLMFSYPSARSSACTAALRGAEEAEQARQQLREQSKVIDPMQSWHPSDGSTTSITILGGTIGQRNAGEISPDFVDTTEENELVSYTEQPVQMSEESPLLLPSSKVNKGEVWALVPNHGRSYATSYLPRSDAEDKVIYLRSAPMPTTSTTILEKSQRAFLASNHSTDQSKAIDPIHHEHPSEIPATRIGSSGRSIDEEKAEEIAPLSSATKEPRMVSNSDKPIELSQERPLALTTSEINQGTTSAVAPSHRRSNTVSHLISRSDTEDDSLHTSSGATATASRDSQDVDVPNLHSKGPIQTVHLDHVKSLVPLSVAGPHLDSSVILGTGNSMQLLRETVITAFNQGAASEKAPSHPRPYMTSNQSNSDAKENPMSPCPVDTNLRAMLGGSQEANLPSHHFAEQSNAVDLIQSVSESPGSPALLPVTTKMVSSVVPSFGNSVELTQETPLQLSATSKFNQSRTPALALDHHRPHVTGAELGSDAKDYRTFPDPSSSAILPSVILSRPEANPAFQCAAEQNKTVALIHSKSQEDPESVAPLAVATTPMDSSEVSNTEKPTCLSQTTVLQLSETSEGNKSVPSVTDVPSSTANDKGNLPVLLQPTENTFSIATLGDATEACLAEQLQVPGSFQTCSSVDQTPDDRTSLPVTLQQAISAEGAGPSLSDKVASTGPGRAASLTKHDVIPKNEGVSLTRAFEHLAGETSLKLNHTYCLVPAQSSMDSTTSEQPSKDSTKPVCVDDQLTILTSLPDTLNTMPNAASSINSLPTVGSNRKESSQQAKPSLMYAPAKISNQSVVLAQHSHFTGSTLVSATLDEDHILPENLNFCEESKENNPILALADEANALKSPLMHNNHSCPISDVKDLSSHNEAPVSISSDVNTIDENIILQSTSPISYQRQTADNQMGIQDESCRSQINDPGNLSEKLEAGRQSQQIGSSEHHSTISMSQQEVNRGTNQNVNLELMIDPHCSDVLYAHRTSGPLKLFIRTSPKGSGPDASHGASLDDEQLVRGLYGRLLKSGQLPITAPRRFSEPSPQHLLIGFHDLSAHQATLTSPLELDESALKQPSSTSGFVGGTVQEGGLKDFQLRSSQTDLTQSHLMSRLLSVTGIDSLGLPTQRAHDDSQKLFHSEESVLQNVASQPGKVTTRDKLIGPFLRGKDKPVLQRVYDSLVAVGYAGTDQQDSLLSSTEEGSDHSQKPTQFVLKNVANQPSETVSSTNVLGPSLEEKVEPALDQLFSAVIRYTGTVQESHSKESELSLSQINLAQSQQTSELHSDDVGTLFIEEQINQVSHRSANMENDSLMTSKMEVHDNSQHLYKPEKLVLQNVDNRSAMTATSENPPELQDSSMRQDTALGLNSVYKRTELPVNLSTVDEEDFTLSLIKCLQHLVNQEKSAGTTHDETSKSDSDTSEDLDTSSDSWLLNVLRIMQATMAHSFMPCPYAHYPIGSDYLSFSHHTNPTCMRRPIFVPSVSVIRI